MKLVAMIGWNRGRMVLCTFDPETHEEELIAPLDGAYNWRPIVVTPKNDGTLACVDNN